MKKPTVFDFDFRKRVDSCDTPLTTRVRLFTGYSCNYNCCFCFYKNNVRDSIKPLKKLIYNQVDISKKYGIDSFDISGGEPTIIPCWFEMLKYIKSLDFKNIAVITNGSMLCEMDFFKKSVDLGLNEVLFSYHGHNDIEHDSLTGIKGSFKKLNIGIENAKKIGTKIRINTVVTKHNYKSLSLIAKNILSISPACFNFLPFRIESTAPKENNLSYSVMCNKIKKSIDILKKIKDINIVVRYVPFCLMQNYEKYVCGWKQRLYDPYEWSEFLIHYFDSLCDDKYTNVDDFNYRLNKNLEYNAILETLKTECGFRFSCLKCKYILICDGIWKTYADIFGVDELKHTRGKQIKNILHFNERSIIF